MIQTGVCSLAELLSDVNAKTLFTKRLKNVSIALYEEACAQENADELTQRILLLFSDARGAYKRTYVKRFEEFDQKVCALLQENVQGSLTVHDIGVSDGRTAVDFFNKLHEIFPDIHFTASDYNPTIKLLERGPLKVALSDTDELLEFTCPPFVFNAVKRDSYLNYFYYPLNVLVKFFLKRFKVMPLLEEYQNKRIHAKTLFLFAPSAINLQKNNKKFVLAQHNILQPLEKQYAVIRVMNLLNLSYFSKNDFLTIIENLYNGLQDNGILVTGSNQDADSIVDGAVYQKSKNGFTLLWSSGKGSPIHHLIEPFSR